MCVRMCVCAFVCDGPRATVYQSVCVCVCVCACVCICQKYVYVKDKMCACVVETMLVSQHRKKNVHFSDFVCKNVKKWKLLKYSGSLRKSIVFLWLYGAG